VQQPPLSRGLPVIFASHKESIIQYVDIFLFFSFLLMVFFLPLFETWKNLWFSFALFFWLVRMVIARDFKIKLYPIGAGYLVFLGAACLSALFSINLFQGLRGAWDIFRSFAVYLLIVNTFDSKKHIHLSIAVLLISITIGSIWGLIGYYISGDQFLEVHSLGYKNHTATYLAIVLSLCGGIIVTKTHFGLRNFLLLGIMTIVGWALLLTQSRAAWVALAIVYSTFFLLVRTRRSWVNLGLFIILLGILGFAFQPVKERMETLLRLPSKNNALVVRVKSWRNTLGVIQDHPILGVGPRNFNFIDHEKYNLVGWNHAHSLYWATLKRAREGCLSAEQLGYWLGAVGALLIIMISGIVSTPLHTEGAMAFAILLGIMVVSALKDETRSDIVLEGAITSVDETH
jgi:O-antigen ligase